MAPGKLEFNISTLTSLAHTEGHNSFVLRRNLLNSYLSKLTDTLNFWGGSGAPQGRVVGVDERHAITTPLKWKPAKRNQNIVLIVYTVRNVQVYVRTSNNMLE